MIGTSPATTDRSTISSTIVSDDRTACTSAGGSSVAVAGCTMRAEANSGDSSDSELCVNESPRISVEGL